MANVAPSGTDATVSIPRNYALRLSNFGFSDTDGNSLAAVRFTTLPTNGTLYYDANGALGGGRVAVTAGQTISAADIAAGKVTFVAAPTATGTNYASLTFQVQDNGGTAGGGIDLDQSPNTLTFDIALGSSFGTLIDLTGLPASVGFKIQGDIANDFAGSSVSSAGDVNGDGFADIIIGARGNDSGGSNAGAAYVIFGRASGFGSLIDLTGLSATDGFKIQGDVANDFAGFSVSSAGDVNGDGFADILVGAYGNDSGDANAGAAYVIFGRASGFGSLIDLTGLAVTDGFKIQGDLLGDQAGWSVSSAGDVNGDGFADILVGANGNDSGGGDAGAAYVIFGRASGFGSLIDLTSLSAANGFKIQGDFPSDQAGFSVSSAGDVNADGFADILVGARGNDGGGGNAGSAYVIFGRGSGFGSLIDLTGLAPTDGFMIQGDVASDFAGYSVSSAGDVNGDGFADILVGANGNGSGGTNAGAAYVIFGKASGFGSLIDLTGLSATDGFKIQGDASYDNAGISVSSAGDVNGDGFADILVGARINASGGLAAGAAYVIFGRGSGFGSLIDLTGLSAANGFKIQGDVAYDNAGTSVSAAGDVNGDGFADILVGARNNGSGGLYAGAGYVIFGRAPPLPNAAPAGTDATLTINEDAPRTLTAADFGFSDADGNTLLAVRITTLPTAGTLALNGVPVVAGDTIPVGSLPQLVFTPALNANGTGYASFTFQVQDNGGSAGGGVDLDQSPNTITFDVTPVNDAPTISGFPAFATYTPGVAGNFNFSPTTIADVDSSILTVTITPGPAAFGTFTVAPGAGITVGGSGTTVTLTGSAADINAYLDTPSNIQFTPGGNGSMSLFITASDGALSSLTAQAGVTSSFAAVSINDYSAPITQNFDQLFSGSGFAGFTPRGWTFGETGTSANTLFATGTGSGNTGDTYSFGPAGNSDRALGGLRSGGVIPTIGGAFTNNTAFTISSLVVSYTGEQWRLGANGRNDRLDFEISTNASSLTTGTWTGRDALDFVAPISTGTVGALNGNLAANRTAVSFEITGLSITPGATVWLRWSDFDASGADDGLAIDDFSLTARAMLAVADTAAVNENATITGGNLFANDINLGGGTLGVVRVNGNPVFVGNQITLASGALLTVNANGTFSYNPNGAFNYLVDPAVAAATGASNGSATDSFTYELANESAAIATITINGVTSSGDELRGGPGNDTVTGTSGNDFYNLTQGGNDVASGGDGNDAFLFGAAFTAADTIDGGTGNDQVGISGDYSGGLIFNANTLTNVEVLALLPGAGNRYSITTNDGNVAAGGQLTIFAGNLGAGQNFTFDGSAETDGSFLTYGGLGTDSITGGAGDDGFYFGPGKWQPGDIVAGGGGNDQLALDGDYAITIGSEAGVETLVLLAGPSTTPNNFNITLSDLWATSGASRTVFARNVTTALTINGSAESNANLTYFGGRAGDTLTTGGGDDVIHGLEGNDSITGGDGSDTAVYQGARATYSVVTGGGNVQIVDNDAVADGDDGTDTVVGIEFAQFSDQTISITSPIILDLDGGGVQTLSASASSARFDMDGDGVGDDTSWFGRGEGLLFLDRDGNGTLSNAGEMSFTGDVANARSDLEGLRAWDSNGDGQLSSADARFRDFKIWRDRDGDGVVDRREVMTLRQAGVRSLSLTGTANSGSYALGDTAVVNTGTFTRTNGRQGGLIDAVLTAVSSKAEAEQRGTVQAPAVSIDRSLLGGSFDDALASLSNGGGRDSLEQRVMPIAGALMPERDLGGTGALDAFTSAMGATSPARSGGSGSSLDAGDLALASATPLTVIEHGNTLFDSLDARLALMTQDMAAFGAQTSVTEIDQWRRQGNAQVDLFAA